jgi:hypothetical protein
VSQCMRVLGQVFESGTSGRQIDQARCLGPIDHALAAELFDDAVGEIVCLKNWENVLIGMLRRGSGTETSRNRREAQQRVQMGKGSSHDKQLVRFTVSEIFVRP